MTPAPGTPWPRLIATDLDGSLLGTEGLVSDRTRQVLTAVEELGVPVVFVTGRPIRWMEKLWDAVGGHGLAICSNGGVVYDVATHRVRSAHTIDRRVLLEVGQTLRRVVPGTSFALEKTTGFALEPEFFPDADDRHFREIPRGPLEEIVEGRVVKLLARHDELAPAQFWSVVEETVGTRVTTTWSSVGSLVEMSALGVTKASALADLCAELRIEPSEVVAFGDMPNDLPMLEWAGTSYAMANAHPTVLELADHTAGLNTEDGVAEALVAIFGL